MNNLIKPFSKNEIKYVGGVLLVIFILSFFNFRISIRRARDNQRKNDLGTLQGSLEKYNQKTGIYPLSTEDGKIISCKDENTIYDPKTDTWENVKACEWGKDALYDFRDTELSYIMNPIPNDPKNLEGKKFVYLSNGKRFQLLGYLEGEDEPEFNLKVKERKIDCGGVICNYGRASGSTPLDKSIEEYENELLQLE